MDLLPETHKPNKICIMLSQDCLVIMKNTGYNCMHFVSVQLFQFKKKRKQMIYCVMLQRIVFISFQV